MTAVEEVDARATKMPARAALALAGQVDRVVVAKRGRVLTFDLLRDRPDDATLTDALLGPTGNLRAPTMRVGRTLVVGFDEATYRAVLGTKG